MAKSVTSGGAHLRDLAPEQHSYEGTSQRWRVFGDAASALREFKTGPLAPSAVPFEYLLLSKVANNCQWFADYTTRHV